MFLIERQLDEIHDLAVQLAWLGVQASDNLQRELTPDRLQSAQEGLRGITLIAEQRLRRLAQRDQRRPIRLPKRPWTPEFGRKWEAFRSVLQQRENALRGLRNLARQCGDALAWVVLRMNPRLILPLYSSSRSHHLPFDVSAAGPLQLASNAHRTNRFLVLDNDLTRCIGIGDLTVVASDGAWTTPLSVEVKTRGEVLEGRLARMELIVAHTSHPVNEALYSDFVSILTEASEGEVPYRRREARQAREILERAELGAKLQTGRRKTLEQPRTDLWPSIERTLRNACQTGVAVDIAEDGVAVMGVLNIDPSAAVSATRQAKERLEALGFTSGHRILSSTDLQGEDYLSTVARPIALWPISADLRIKLLTGQLFYACVFSASVWENAFQRLGIAWREDENRWILNRENDQAVLDAVEVQRAFYGLAFSGISPQEIAKTAAEGFI